MHDKDRDRYREERRYYRRKYRNEYRYNNRGRGLWSGFSLLCIGCILVAIGLSFGGHWTNFQWWPWQNGNSNFNWNFNGIGNTGDANVIQDIVELNDTIPANVTKLDIKLKAASLVIKNGADGSYRATDFGKGAITVRLDGNTLVVDETDWRHDLNFGNNFPKPTLEIVLPDGINLGSCDISVGAGSVNIVSAKMDEFKLESGAGSFKGNGLTAKKAEIQTGAGSIEMDDCAFGDTRIKTGAGRVVYTGSLGERTEISTGAGSVEMKVAGSLDDYRVEYSRGLGSVRIDGESFNGVGDGSAGNRKAEKQIKLSSGIGSVALAFGK